MMNSRTKLTVRVLLVVIFVSHSAAVSSILNKDIKSSQCGGTIEGDINSLEYPNAGEVLKAGEVCVWTIHLQTTKDFRFNFTHLNVSSGVNDDNCGDSGVRLYTLTNLAPLDNLESYTFCSENQWDQPFFLGETVAVVVLFVGVENLNPGYGFSLSWEGRVVDSLRTKHLSSFTSLPTGVIRYPVIGEYEPRIIATWLVEANPSMNVETEVRINSLDLETCDIPNNPCACDALIVYDISDQGVMRERQRLCEDIGSGIDLSLMSRFIIGFFSDFIEEDNKGTGFDIVYFPGQTVPPTTSTTEIPTTQSPLLGTECGEVLSGSNSGRIEYKLSGGVIPNERCVWTIRVPDADAISFDLLSSDFSSERGEMLSIITMKKYYSTLTTQSADLTYPISTSSFTLNGTVAIVVFSMGLRENGKGFTLSYRGVGDFEVKISPESIDYIGFNNGSFDYPYDNSTYSNVELSTFLLTPPNFVTACLTPPCFSINFTSYGLDIPSPCDCCDKIRVFEYGNKEIPTWKEKDVYCNDRDSVNFESITSVLLYVFESDESVVGNGFHLDYEYLIG